MEITTEPSLSQIPKSPDPLRKSKKKARPERLAWLVILISFAVFCLLVWWAINLIGNFLSNTIQSKYATLSLQGNYTFILRPDQNHEVQGSQGDLLHEGDTVHTDKDGQAEIVLFDNTHLHLFPDTHLTFKALHLSGFGRTHEDIEFVVTTGIVKMSAAAHKSEDILSAFTNDGADIRFDNLAGGDYRIELERNSDGTSRTWISNYSSSGSVSVKANGSGIQKLGANQQLLVAQGAPPSPPDALGVELLANGSFLDGLDGWAVGYDQGGDGGTTDALILADSELLADQTKTRTHFLRYGGDSLTNYSQVTLSQNIDKYVADYDHLNLEFYVKLKYQSLQGGGALGSEYPFTVEIYYTDKNGAEQRFFNGFYYINNEPGNQTYDHVSDQLLHSQEIRNNVWEHYTLDLVKLHLQPIRINRVVIGASGHQYESYCTGISLRAS